MDTKMRHLGAVSASAPPVGFLRSREQLAFAQRTAQVLAGNSMPVWRHYSPQGATKRKRARSEPLESGGHWHGLVDRR
jgi:hypothetical protein